MAAPFLQSVDHFCKNTYEYQHDIYKPTKHNSLCNYKPVWDVIKENIDFVNVEQMNTTLQPPETNFEIMYPYENGKFVLAIDTSSNMNYKMDSLQLASNRWIKYLVSNGTEIGIISFSDSASVKKALTKVDESNRDEFVRIINNLRPSGSYRCSGSGLMKAMDVSLCITAVDEGMNSNAFLKKAHFKCKKFKFECKQVST